MSDSFRTFDELISDYADNDSGQINAQSGRNLITSTYRQTPYVATQQNITNSTSLVLLNDLVCNVVAGGVYKFKGQIFTAQDNTGGGKVSLGGTATISKFYGIVKSWDGFNLLYVSGFQTATYGSFLLVSSGSTPWEYLMEGVAIINVGGTFGPTLAQHTAVPATSASALVGSNFELQRIG